mmetsp:Transcript_80239/g.211541  ORF Transcript_80239/g.211541 Transcript_80239/m.211541 type:complete len:359 (-) Transcript_80239:345-1421(-)
MIGGCARHQERVSRNLRGSTRRAYATAAHLSASCLLQRLNLRHLLQNLSHVVLPPSIIDDSLWIVRRFHCGIEGLRADDADFETLRRHEHRDLEVWDVQQLVQRLRLQLVQHPATGRLLLDDRVVCAPQLVRRDRQQVAALPSLQLEQGRLRIFDEHQRHLLLAPEAHDPHGRLLDAEGREEGRAADESEAEGLQADRRVELLGLGQVFDAHCGVEKALAAARWLRNQTELVRLGASDDVALGGVAQAGGSLQGRLDICDRHGDVLQTRALSVALDTVCVGDLQAISEILSAVANHRFRPRLRVGTVARDLAAGLQFLMPQDLQAEHVAAEVDGALQVRGPDDPVRRAAHRALTLPHR